MAYYCHLTDIKYLFKFWHQAVMQDSFNPHQVSAIKSFKSRKLVGETQERRVGNPEERTLRLTSEEQKKLS